MIAGAVLIFVGVPLFAGVLFGHGGVRKSAQFRVLGELMRGLHGNMPRALLLLSLLLIFVGSCLSFVAVGAGHLAGRGSVQDYLAGRGLSVTRIQ